MAVELPAVPTAVLVGIGGAVGALGRFAVDTALDGGRRSTFAVNVFGSTILGVGIGWLLVGL